MPKAAANTRTRPGNTLFAGLSSYDRVPLVPSNSNGSPFRPAQRGFPDKDRNTHAEGCGIGFPEETPVSPFFIQKPYSTSGPGGRHTTKGIFASLHNVKRNSSHGHQPSNDSVESIKLFLTNYNRKISSTIQLKARTSLSLKCLAAYARSTGTTSAWQTFRVVTISSIPYLPPHLQV